MSDLLNSASLVMIPSGYKEDVVYSQIPTDGSGDLSFTRASNGTRINSAGLLEVCPWNLVEQSETFGVLPWNSNAGGTVDNNATTAPNGTTTADRLNCTSSGASGLYQIFNTISGQSYTSSIYIKNDSNSTDILLGTDAFPSTANIRYNPSTNTIISVGSAITSSSVENVGNGWYRVIFSYVVTGSFNAFVIYSVSLTTNSLFVWGAQSNYGSTAKPYFPTTDRLNVPRLTYQNGGGGCPSLLLEKQSTNLNLYSQDLTNAAYPTGGSGGTVTTTANYGISPDGTQNATRIQISRNTGASSYAEIYQRVSVTVGVTYTLSFYAKSLSGTPTLITAFNDGYFNEVTFTTDWVKYTYTFVATGAFGSGFNLLTYTPFTNTSASADLLVWGVQLEASSYPTSYIPTTSSSATRVADECSKTGISSLIGQTEGTIFLDFVLNDNLNSNYINIYNNQKDASAVSVVAMQFNGDTFVAYTFRGNGTFDSIQLSASGYGIGQRMKIAYRYKSGDFALYINGVQKGTSSATMTFNGTKSEIYLHDPTVYFAYQGAVQFNEFVQFATALSNADLQALTT